MHVWVSFNTPPDMYMWGLVDINAKGRKVSAKRFPWQWLHKNVSGVLYSSDRCHLYFAFCCQFLQIMMTDVDVFDLVMILGVLCEVNRS